MANEIAEQDEALAKLQVAVRNTKRSMPNVGGPVPYLKMGKDGFWVFGAKNEEVQDGSLWAIDPLSYRYGFVCWTNYPKEAKRKNENLGVMTVALDEEALTLDDMPTRTDKDTGKNWPWAPVIEMRLKCVFGEDQGTEVLWQTSSVGGTRLGSEYLEELDRNIAKGLPVAVVKLVSESYDHTQYGKIYTPTFVYDRWLPLGTTSLDDAPEEIEAPVADEEVKKDAAPAPTRKRRRPAA